MNTVTPTAPRRPRLNALTGIRFFAALHVMIYHGFRANFYQLADTIESHFKKTGTTGYLFSHLLGGSIRRVVFAGPTSVGLFFILSGFILAYTYLDREGRMTESTSLFYIKRFARIYPTYLLGVLLAAPFEILRYKSGVLGPHSGTFPAQWGTFTWTGLLSITLLQAWVPSVATTWNAPGWSLSVEALFYVSFPLLAGWFIRRSTTTSAIFIAVLSVLCIFLLGLAHATLASGAVISTWDEAAVDPYFAFLPVLRLPEFILGVAVGRWFFIRHAPGDSTNDRPLFHWMAPLAALAVPGVLAVAYSDWARVVIRPTILAVLFACLVVGLAVNAAGRPGLFTRFLSLSPLILLGEASYAIYIIHVPMIRYVDRLPHEMWNKIARALHLPSGGTAQAIAYLFATVGTAVAIFLFLETPSRRWLRARLKAVFIRPEPDLQTSSKMSVRM